MASLHLQELKGTWSTGIALDHHTLSSKAVGLDAQGRQRFETVRSALGELLYKFKYQGDLGAAQQLISIAAGFVKSRQTDIEVVVPVPPSKERSLQPVPYLAHGIAISLGFSFAPCVSKTRGTLEQKAIIDPVERGNVLRGLFQVDGSSIKGKSVLLFDDLYRSGATLNAVTEQLLQVGLASRVRVLTLTKTRVNL